MDYSQPSFYHFNQDSLELVSFVEASCRHRKEIELSVLDLCAGCGVIGFELLLKFPKWSFDFCELQDDFFSHYLVNKDLIQNERQGKLGAYYRCDFRELNSFSLKKKYDLIVANPPYFSPQAGRLSPDEKRRKCRFFTSQDWLDLFACFEGLLTNSGQAFFLARENLWPKDKRIQQVALLSGARIFSFHLDIK